MTGGGAAGGGGASGGAASGGEDGPAPPCAHSTARRAAASARVHIASTNSCRASTGPLSSYTAQRPARAGVCRKGARPPDQPGARKAAKAQTAAGLQGTAASERGAAGGRHTSAATHSAGTVSAGVRAQRRATDSGVFPGALGCALRLHTQGGEGGRDRRYDPGVHASRPRRRTEASKNSEAALPTVPDASGARGRRG